MTDEKRKIVLWLKKVCHALTDPKISLGGAGVALIAYISPFILPNYISNPPGQEPKKSPEIQTKEEEKTAVPAQKNDISLRVEWKNVFPTSKGFRARLWIQAGSENKEKIYLHGLSIYLKKINDDKPDLSLIRNQGSAPITSIFFVDGEKGRLYWRTEEGKCFRSDFPVDNLFNIPSPPIMISLQENEIYAIDVEFVSENPGVFNLTLIIESSNSYSSKITKDSVMQLSSIGGAVNENKNCH